MTAAQKTRDVQPMSVQCWVSVEDDGPTLPTLADRLVFAGCSEQKPSINISSTCPNLVLPGKQQSDGCTLFFLFFVLSNL